MPIEAGNRPTNATVVYNRSMNTSPLRGVNLGGWLIVERWMTPSVFKDTDAIDEYTLSSTTEGRKAIASHHQTFITEDDFKWLHKNGINAVRIPIGYWLFGNEGKLTPHLASLDWAMDMAKKYSLQVIIDLHGLKGSQNGYDHSGRIGALDWFKHASYRTETLETLEALARRYAHEPHFWGIQIINEPQARLFHFKLRSYYKKAYTLLDGILQTHTRIIYSDAFTPRLMSRALGDARRAVMDIHLYHSIQPINRFISLKKYYDRLRRKEKLFSRLSAFQPVIIGEWSGVFHQKTFDKYPAQKHAELIKEHVQRQIEAYQHTAGWFYWNYKTEKPGVWNFRSQVEAGIIEL